MAGLKSYLLNKYTIAGVVILLALVLWGLYKYKLVNKSIHKAVTEKTEGLYHLYYDSLQLDEVGGTLSASNVRLVADTAVYHRLRKAHKTSPLLFQFTIPVLKILRVKTPKALLDKQIEAGKIEIDHPAIEIMGLEETLKDTVVAHPGKEIYEQILGKFKSMRIDSIEIRHAHVMTRSMKTGKTRFEGSDVSLLLTDALVDSVVKDDSSRILFSRNLDLGCREIIIPSRNKKYQFHFEDLAFSSRNNRFNAGRIRIMPLLGEAEFAASYPYSKDRYDFVFENLSLININRESLWHKRIEADSLLVSKSSFKVYRDISRPHDSVSRVGLYPQQLLMRLRIPIAIKKIVFPHSFIEYKEKNGKSDESGKLQFHDVSASISNVTNMPGHIARNNLCVLDFKSKFLNQAPLKARLSMWLKNPDGKFMIEGTLGSMPAPGLNTILEPMALARVDKGNIDRLEFHLQADSYHCHGPLLFLYRDLKIALLKKDKEEDKYKKKGLPSLAANIIMKNSNKMDDKPRTAHPDFKRDTHRSMFHLMWKTIFTGVKEAAGMK